MEQGLILVIPDKSDTERDDVASAWERRGGTVCRVGAFWNPPALSPAQVRLYGNTMFCLVLEQKLGLRLLSPPDDWILSLPGRLLQRTLGSLPLDECLAGSWPTFVKPLVPKLFRASVYTSAEALATETSGLALSTVCLVAEPVHFLCEVRCLVLNNLVVDASAYEGTADRDEAHSFAQSCIESSPLPGPFVLDVGVIEGRGWAVLEANPVWGAGLNGCRADAMVDCLLAATTTAGQDPTIATLEA